MKKATPAPIFNMNRKRPRQAIIADPQNLDGPGMDMSSGLSHDQSSHNYPDLMPVTGFDGRGYVPNQQKPGNLKSFQQQNKSQHNNFNFSQYQHPNRQQQTQSQQYSNNRSSFGRPSQNSGHQGTSKPMTGGQNRTGQGPSNSNWQLSGGSRQSGQGWQPNKNVQQSKAWSGGQVSYTNKHGASSYTDSQKTQQRHQNTGNSNTYGQQQNRYSDGRHNYHGQEADHRTQNYGSNSTQNNGYMNMNQFQAGPQRNQNRFRPGPSGAASYQGVDNSVQHFQAGVPQANQQIGGFGDSSNKQKSSTNQVQKEHPKKTKTDQKVDKSLHLITASIQGVKHWSKYRDSINMIFEVYGVVDSAMMQDPSATGKEFLIKDEQDSMSCIFYEIDRQLPRLTRGHWHRCVGTVDGRSGKLKCVSVRPASMEEKDLSKISIKTSDVFLWEATKSTPEP